MHDFRIFIDAPLNSPVRVDTFRHQNHVSSLYRSNFSSKLKLQREPQVIDGEVKTLMSFYSRCLWI